MMLDLYLSLEELVDRSPDPFNTAMRLAIAGNVIDFGSQYQFDVMNTINGVIGSKLAIDDSPQLRNDLKHAATLLYIGDNCGEIVLDKLFLETINLPRMDFLVRDGPIINDATLNDANMAGMETVVKFITTGDDAPGTVWESTSKEFKDHFTNADIVISKGQDNLEGLIDVPHDQIYFLLVTKCDLIAERIGKWKGEFVIKRETANENNNPL